MRNHCTLGALVTLALLSLACGEEPAAPIAEVAGLTPTASFQAWGPETPPFNLEVVLRGDGFGLVKFRQPNDDEAVVHLDTWVRDLVPNHRYYLQRAVDQVVDGVCTSASGWLTLGQGLAPYAIETDANGTGRAALWRAVPPTFGTPFDIHFRVIDDDTGAVVLQSECYQYTISL